jgi:hypothetical protein
VENQGHPGGGEFDETTIEDKLARGVHHRWRRHARQPGLPSPGECASRRLSHSATPAMRWSASLGPCAAQLQGGVARFKNSDGPRSSYRAGHCVISFGCGSERSDAGCASPVGGLQSHCKKLLFFCC